jgi:hypothetical protein
MVIESALKHRTSMPIELTLMCVQIPVQRRVSSHFAEAQVS